MNKLLLPDDANRGQPLPGKIGTAWQRLLKPADLIRRLGGITLAIDFQRVKDALNKPKRR